MFKKKKKKKKSIRRRLFRARHNTYVSNDKMTKYF